jgi:hypothetical protein
VKREGLCAVVIAMLVVAGCGGDEVSVHSQAAQQVRLTEAEPEDPAEDEPPCAADLKTLQTAWEAYYAVNGVPPASEQDLVDAGLIRQLSDGFDLVGTEFVAVPSVCH